MKIIRWRVRLLSALFLAAFGLMSVYFVYSASFYGGRWVGSPHNPRIRNGKRAVAMGTVSDRDGVLLAWTDDRQARHYNRSASVRRATSQVVGDSEGRVSTGVDTFHAQYLLGFKAGFFERLSDALAGQVQRGDDLRLTISSALCRSISERFPEDRRGAVVVMNWKTGEILAMVSMPQFDPEDLTLALEDEDAGALINRCTQGLYPPGSTMKIVTLAAALSALPDARDFSFDCTGYYPVGSYSVTEGRGHGRVGLGEAFAASCNTAFAALSQELGYEGMGTTAERLGFNENFMYDDLIVYNSRYPIDGLSPEDLAWSAIGQGRVLVTPMHMAMIASAIASGGTLPEPRLLSEIRTPQGGRRPLPAGGKSALALPREVAEEVERDMLRCVSAGTGRRAAISGYPVAGKTGTAEASDDKSVLSHAWFVGYVARESAPYAVAVLIEHGGSGGDVAAPLARRALQKAIDLGLAGPEGD